VVAAVLDKEVLPAVPLPGHRAERLAGSPSL